jgi:hypothetical protein
MAEPQDVASIRRADLVREILDHACARRSIAILTTPYLRFESCFLRLEGDRMHCLATMDLEDAKYGLRSPDLRVRFPSGPHFYEGATRLLGLGRIDGRQSLQLAVPAALDNGDWRRSYRVDRVGRVPVTLSTRKYQLLQGRLANISTTGVAVYLLQDPGEPGLAVNDPLHVDFVLSEGPRIQARVEVRHLHERTFGAEFRPDLPDAQVEPLGQWVFRQREADVLARELQPARKDPGIRPPGADGVGEVILISSSPELGERLAALMGGDMPPLRRVAPTIQSVRDLPVTGKVLVLLHADSGSWEDLKRLRALAEALPAGLPRVLVGTGLESGPLFELGTELKAAWTYPLTANPGTLFARLLSGILRKHFPA